MHDAERVDMAQITQIYVRLVYCMAAWDDDGMSRGRTLGAAYRLAPGGSIAVTFTHLAIFWFAK
jgi:hypothetical protein